MAGEDAAWLDNFQLLLVAACGPDQAAREHAEKMLDQARRENGVVFRQSCMRVIERTDDAVTIAAASVMLKEAAIKGWLDTNAKMEKGQRAASLSPEKMSEMIQHEEEVFNLVQSLVDLLRRRQLIGGAQLMVTNTIATLLRKGLVHCWDRFNGTVVVLLNLVKGSGDADSGNGGRGDPQLRHLGLTILTHLTVDFSSTNVARIGVTWIRNREAKMKFESKILQPMMQFVLSALESAVSHWDSAVTAPKFADELKLLIAALEAFSDWDFTYMKSCSFASAEPNFVPPADWRDVIFGGGLGATRRMTLFQIVTELYKRLQFGTAALQQTAPEIADAAFVLGFSLRMILLRICKFRAHKITGNASMNDQSAKSRITSEVFVPIAVELSNYFVEYLKPPFGRPIIDDLSVLTGCAASLATNSGCETATLLAEAGVQLAGALAQVGAFVVRSADPEEDGSTNTLDNIAQVWTAWSLKLRHNDEFNRIPHEVKNNFGNISRELAEVFLEGGVRFCFARESDDQDYEAPPQETTDEAAGVAADADDATGDSGSLLFGNSHSDKVWDHRNPFTHEALRSWATVCRCAAAHSLEMYTRKVSDCQVQLEAAKAQNQGIEEVNKVRDRMEQLVYFGSHLIVEESTGMGNGIYSNSRIAAVFTSDPQYQPMLKVVIESVLSYLIREASLDATVSGGASTAILEAGIFFCSYVVKTYLFRTAGAALPLFTESGAGLQLLNTCLQFLGEVLTRYATDPTLSKCAAFALHRCCASRRYPVARHLWDCPVFESLLTSLLALADPKSESPLCGLQEKYLRSFAAFFADACIAPPNDQEEPENQNVILKMAQNRAKLFDACTPFRDFAVNMNVDGPADPRLNHLLCRNLAVVNGLLSGLAEAPIRPLGRGRKVLAADEIAHVVGWLAPALAASQAIAGSYVMYLDVFNSCAKLHVYAVRICILAGLKDTVVSVAAQIQRLTDLFVAAHGTRQLPGALAAAKALADSPTAQLQHQNLTDESQIMSVLHCLYRGAWNLMANGTPLDPERRLDFVRLAGSTITLTMPLVTQLAPLPEASSLVVKLMEMVHHALQKEPDCFIASLSPAGLGGIIAVTKERCTMELKASKDHVICYEVFHGLITHFVEKIQREDTNSAALQGVNLQAPHVPFSDSSTKLGALAMKSAEMLVDLFVKSLSVQHSNLRMDLFGDEIFDGLLLFAAMNDGSLDAFLTKVAEICVKLPGVEVGAEPQDAARVFGQFRAHLIETINEWKVRVRSGQPMRRFDDLKKFRSIFAAFVVECASFHKD